MNEDVTIAVGDWIRFYNNGRLVIAQVEYIRLAVGGYTEYCTDQGVTRDVLEVRKS